MPWSSNKYTRIQQSHNINQRWHENVDWCSIFVGVAARTKRDKKFSNVLAFITVSVAEKEEKNIWCALYVQIYLKYHFCMHVCIRISMVITTVTPCADAFPYTEFLFVGQVKQLDISVFLFCINMHKKKSKQNSWNTKTNVPLGGHPSSVL